MMVNIILIVIVLAVIILAYITANRVSKLGQDYDSIREEVEEKISKKAYEQEKEFNRLQGDLKSLREMLGILMNKEQVVKIPYFLENETAQLPIRKKEGDAGYDAFANETVVVKPHTSGKISCGVGFIIPEGFAIQNVNRGGNSLGKAYGQPIWVSDAYIDPNYRGICNFLIVNLGTKPITINAGDRVASVSLGF